MDSSSSGSLQSSSGGGGGGGIGGSHEEEYTSGGTANHEILSPFLPLINSSSTQYHHYPFSNSLDHHHAFSLNPNPSLPRSSLDSPWAAAAPSSAQFVPPSCTDTDTTQLLNPVTSASTMMHPPVQSENNRPNTATTSGGGGAPAAQRGAKKRSRASRRPPTTVLTTDTSNFRAMVQEFTGFPAAPFIPSSPFVRPRLGSGLGLFQTGSNTGGLNSPYLLRPFPQKLQGNNNPSMAANNLSSSTIVDAIASIARSSNLANNLNSMFGTSNANANATSTSSSGSNTANFVNASSSNPSAVAVTNNNNNNSSADPISSFASLHSNSKYSFGSAQVAAGDLDGLIGSNGGSNVNPMRLAACIDGYESVARDKSSRFVNSEFDTAQAMDKGVFGFLNYADLKDKR